MGRHGIQWKQLGTHNKHLSVLDFEKQERQKEVVKKLTIKCVQFAEQGKKLTTKVDG